MLGVGGKWAQDWAEERRPGELHVPHPFAERLLGARLLEEAGPT